MKKLFLGLAAILSLTLLSCNKDDSGLISSEDEAIIANDAAAEAITETADYEIELFSGSDASVEIGDNSLKSLVACPFGGRYVVGQCPIVTIERTDGGYPITKTLDYTDTVELVNGMLISGKIIIVISAPPRTDGATRTVTFENFYIDDVKISGTRVITFHSGEGTGISATVEGDIMITFSDGTYIERTTEKLREFYEGYDTPYDISDDKFRITGFTNSVSSEGFTFSAVITEPIIRLGTCRFAVQGIVQMFKNDELRLELNFGDGTCDDVATISRNGETKQITLGRRFRIRNN